MVDFWISWRTGGGEFFDSQKEKNMGFVLHFFYSDLLLYWLLRYEQRVFFRSGLFVETTDRLNKGVDEL